jgi:uncharacterized protein (TIGR03118 family)
VSGGLLAMQALPAQAQRFHVTHLVSDGSIPAKTVDSSLINPWGMSYAPGGPFWVSDNNWGVSTLYDGAGAKQGLTVNIPPPAGKTGAGTPTGQVYNATSGFAVTSKAMTGAALFIFATEDGTISGWSPSVDFNNAILAVDNSKTAAVYKGLAIATAGKSTFLYAANFRSGAVEIYTSKFTFLRSFTDPTIPAGYAPFNVQNLGGILYVTFARQDAPKHDSVAGAGFGFVDAFTLGGRLIRRVASHGALNAPWGLDIAPTSFGSFAGDLLVGNFGDGKINAYAPSTGAFVGTLLGPIGAPLVLGDLWGLINGDGGSGGDPTKVYFTAGVRHEAHGLFGSLTALAK